MKTYFTTDDFHVGMRVTETDDVTRKGAVMEVDGDCISIRWEDIEYDSDDTEYYEWYEVYHNDVMPDSDEVRQKWIEHTRKVQAKVDEATHSLEAAFQALRDANKLASGHDDYEGAFALRDNPLLNLKELEKAVNNNGWSTSSLYC